MGVKSSYRLIKAKIFVQVNNPQAQRSHLIELTDYGKAELPKIFDKLHTLGKTGTGSLTNLEKGQLVLTMQKLDHFHYDNYNNKDLKQLDYLTI